MGGGHGGKPYEIPDWRIYKVEDVPELLQVKKALHSIGLKDPWLRNEVWRYHPGFLTMRQRGIMFYFRGAKWGTLAFLLSLAAETAYNKLKGDDSAHGHH
ncbi:NADH dehydrogenase [ubiquinone] 1 beta subcomplex subunit 3 [Centruroides vittatus]|uniref:NADH dehydrogenase [ubiquinone] 1 beta subcomplex subunit 3 n=1 Tax=Centruroides vittatus TaxID=120091 RepID=UPI00350ECE42